MRTLKICSVLAGVSLASCAVPHTTRLSPGAEMVRVKEDAPRSCEPVGLVSGRACAEDMADALAHVKDDLRNQTHGQGGNYVKIETSHSRPCREPGQPAVEVLLTGRALRCASPSPQEAQSRR